MVNRERLCKKDNDLSGAKYQDPDSGLMLGLLRAVESDEGLTQRSAATKLGIALGLVNSYLKRCANKGLVKIKQAPANRYAYYLTPQGFAEKTRLTTEFVSQSLSLFRQAKSDYTSLINRCMDRKWYDVVLVGSGELAEIFILNSQGHPINILGVVDPTRVGSEFAGYKVVADIDSLISPPEAYIITDLRQPQVIYNSLIERHPAERVLSPALLDLVTITTKAAR